MRLKVNTVAALLFVLASCGPSKTNFGTGVAKPVVAQASPAGDNVEVKVTATPVATASPTTAPVMSPSFQIDTFSMPDEPPLIDMVWAIDNSGSMNEEAAHVRQNFQNFVSSVSQKTNLHVALISQKGTAGTSVTMPSEDGVTHKQIDVPVGSTNALAMIASASCFDPPLSENPGEKILVASTATSSLAKSVTSICSVPLSSYSANAASTNAIAYLESSAQVDSIRGKLEGFYRPLAAKVFVVVTDDTARGVDHSNFFQALEKGSVVKPTFFGFIGVSKSVTTGCNIASVGEPYIKLSGSGGAVFDICAADWSANFSKLSENVIAVGQRIYKLTKPTSGIINSIKLDGVEWKSYERVGQELRIPASSIPKGNHSLEVNYQTTF